MAISQRMTLLSFVAGADLSNKALHAVKLSQDNTVVPGTVGARCVGILQNNPKQGHAATVCIGGISRAISGGAFNPGDLVTSDASGRIVKGGGTALGVAVSGAQGAGEEVSVLVSPQAAAGPEAQTRKVTSCTVIHKDGSWQVKNYNWYFLPATYSNKKLRLALNDVPVGAVITGWKAVGCVGFEAGEETKKVTFDSALKSLAYGPGSSPVETEEAKTDPIEITEEGPLYHGASGLEVVVAQGKQYQLMLNLSTSIKASVAVIGVEVEYVE